MKKTTLAFSIVVLLALLSVPARTAAQTNIFVNTGATVPTGDFGTYYALGFNFSGLIDFQIGEQVAVGGRVGYHQVRLDDDALLEDAGLSGSGLSISGGTGSLITAMGTVRFFAPAGAGQFYAIGGIGLLRGSISDATISGPGGSVGIDGNSETALGVQVGAGLTIPMGAAAFFGEIDYLIGFTENESTTALPIRLGLSFTPEGN